LLIEAFLYEEQTRRGVSLRHWEMFDDVAAHCTVCHKCHTPCPVKIDFGDVTMNMRNLLRKMGQRRFNPGTSASMLFLNATNPETIRMSRKVMIEWGYGLQRFAHQLLKKWAVKQTQSPPATVGKPALKEQVIYFVNKKMPGNLPKKTARALLDIENADYVPIIRNPSQTSVDTDVVRSDYFHKWVWRLRRCFGTLVFKRYYRLDIYAAVIRKREMATLKKPRK
jgi:Fe-S oxidoreductase